MSFLSRLARKVRKPLLGIARGALATTTGGLSEKAISLGGAIKRAGRVRRAVKGLARAPKLQLADVKYAVPSPGSGVGVKAVAMPGGSLLRKKPSKRRSSTRATAKRKAPRRKKTGKRTAPTGGLNLKALSASWRAAGKPGSWQAWIKANK